jgi:hypothetical protein
MKWLQLGVLVLIAAILLWGADSVKGAFTPAPPRQLTEGRRAFASGNYALAASYFTQVVEIVGGAPRREAAILLAEVRFAQGSRPVAVSVLRQYAPGIDVDSFVAVQPHPRPEPVDAIDLLGDPVPIAREKK